MPIKFSEDCISSDSIDTSIGLKPGEIHLLENLRFYNEEIENDKEFSRILSRHGHIYINDALVQHIDHMHLMLVLHHTLNTLVLVGLCKKN